MVPGTQSDKEIYVVLPNDYTGYYTTDPTIIKELKKAKKLTKVGTNLCGTCVAFLLISLFLPLFQCLPWWVCLMPFVFMVSGFSIGMPIAFKGEGLECKWVDIYFDTDEYKEQFARVMARKEAERDAYLTEKATDLVESYEILDSKKMPKEKKIELLKEYIDRGGK